MPGERRQQLQHPLVGVARLTGERPAHMVRQVEVAYADRVPEDHADDFSGGLRADAADPASADGSSAMTAEVPPAGR